MTDPGGHERAPGELGPGELGSRARRAREHRERQRPLLTAMIAVAVLVVVGAGVALAAALMGGRGGARELAAETSDGGTPAGQTAGQPSGGDAEAAPATTPSAVATVREVVTEVVTETRMIAPSGPPAVTPRVVERSDIGVGPYLVDVRSVCEYQALNYDLFIEVTNTGAAASPARRVRMVYRMDSGAWIGATEGDVPPLEPGQAAPVTFTDTVPCVGEDGSRTVVEISGELL